MLDRDPKTYSRWLTEAELKLVASYASKHGETKAAELCNVATGTVRRAMRLNGVAAWKTGRPPTYTDAERRAWLNFKGSAQAASIHFGVGRSTILREIHKQTDERR